MSGQLIATIEQSGVADSVKMNYLKALFNGKAKATIEGMGYSDQMYHVAWQTSEHDFGRPKLIVNAQPRKVYAHPIIKPHNFLENVKYAQVVSGCVNVLT